MTNQQSNMNSVTFYTLLAAISIVQLFSHGNSGHFVDAIEGSGHRLEGKNLSDLQFDKIHTHAVLQQKDFHVPAQKSLHTRKTISLDGLYDFCFDPEFKGFERKWHSSSLKKSCNTTQFYRMPVPSAFNEIASDTYARNYIGWFWYQTIIDPTQLLENLDSQWFIQFESVNYLAIVWIQQLDNQTSPNSLFLLGSHVGGHLPFILNMTQALRTSGGLRLTILVSNQLTEDTIPGATMIDLTQAVGKKYLKFSPEFDFFHYAGIMGSVNLIRLPSLHVSHVDCVQSKSGFEFTVYLGNSSSHINMSTSITASLVSLEGEILAEQTYPLNNRGTMQLRHSISFETPKLPSWSLADGRVNHLATLFNARFKIVPLEERGSKKLDYQRLNHADVYELKLGFRPSPFAGNTTNDNLVRRKQLQGFGMHHEQLFSGRTMSLASIMKDIYLLKRTGANVLRTSHYPYSPDFLNACDENGIQVIAECPAVGMTTFSDIKQDLHRQILLEMMQRDHHHPSIIMWSIANEPASYKPVAYKYFKKLTEYARDKLALYLKNRHLTAAIAQNCSDDLVAETLDVIMLNLYFGWYDYTGTLETISKQLNDSLFCWARKYTTKPLIVSEFGADAIAGLHSLTRELFTEEYQRDLLVEYERVFDQISGCSKFLNSSSSNCLSANTTDKNGLLVLGEKLATFWGSMVWNFADFNTHNALFRAGGNRKGIYTRQREPKLAANTLSEIYLNRLK